MTQWLSALASLAQGLGSFPKHPHGGSQPCLILAPGCLLPSSGLHEHLRHSLHMCHTYLPTYLPTYLHTYILACILTYLQTYRYAGKPHTLKIIFFKLVLLLYYELQVFSQYCHRAHGYLRCVFK